MFDFKIIFSFLVLTGFACKSRWFAHAASPQMFSEHFYNASVSKGAASDDAEVELSVVEGGNLTVFTTTILSEEDPQILTSRLHEASEDLIAQLTCYNNNCTSEGSEPAVFIRYYAQNVTIVIVNATRNQTGRYKVYVHSGTRNENWMYVITVFESTRSPESPPSYIISKPVTAGIGATVGILVLALIIGAIYRIYRIYHRKGVFQSVPDEVP
ncbi:uncharacterized protein LOC130571757 [Triplophysa rosa]|uniref:Uncharacterized protein n=1 Tax=Triplophysa rosa TaxID=992332 RepID=A0A9W7T9Z8_TRIRA|nr:uncharacterized protein LOC130571757 [Triplophysa rosa]KAI7794548.1 hypothetical protein IRJ41_015348 [Triplophysa rosa]